MFKQELFFTSLQKTASVGWPKRRTLSETSAEAARTGGGSLATNLSFEVTAKPPRAGREPGAGACPLAHPRRPPRPALHDPPRGRAGGTGPTRCQRDAEALPGEARPCPAAPPGERRPAPTLTLQAAQGSLPTAPPATRGTPPPPQRPRYLRREGGRAPPRPARRRLLLADLLLQLLEHGGGRGPGVGGRGAAGGEGNGVRLPGRSVSASRAAGEGRPGGRCRWWCWAPLALAPWSRRRRRLLSFLGPPPPRSRWTPRLLRLRSQRGTERSGGYGLRRGTNFPTERQAPFLPSSRPGGGRRLSAARPALSGGRASPRLPLRGGRRRRAGNCAGGGEALPPCGRVTAFLSGGRENGAVTTTAAAAALLRLPGAERGVGAAVTVRSATLTSPPAGQGRPAPPPGSCAPRQEKVHPDPTPLGAAGAFLRAGACEERARAAPPAPGQPEAMRLRPLVFPLVCSACG